MKSALEDYLRSGPSGGKRYLYTHYTEPLAKSIKRRLSLVWGCLTLRPDYDFYERFSPFRQQETTTTVVFPGDPGYEEADGWAPVYAKVLTSQSPWINFLPEDPPPNEQP